MPRSRLRAARERAGLTQAELAERAAVSRQLVGAIEAGRHSPAIFDTALRMPARWTRRWRGSSASARRTRSRPSAIP